MDKYTLITFSDYFSGVQDIEIEDILFTHIAHFAHLPFFFVFFFLTS